jgi:hypothetical protein
MATTIPALPYRGPSHDLGALERLALRETCRRGLAWADLTERERNEWIDWAGSTVTFACRVLDDDPGWTRFLPAKLDPDAGLSSWEVDDLKERIASRHQELVTRLPLMRDLRRAFEGQDR